VRRTPQVAPLEKAGRLVLVVDEVIQRRANGVRRSSGVEHVGRELYIVRSLSEGRIERVFDVQRSKVNEAVREIADALDDRDGEVAALKTGLLVWEERAAGVGIAAGRAGRGEDGIAG
jgi:hypothetical protein